MKLGKCKNKQMIIKRKTIVLMVFICVLSYGLFGYQSYGRYQDKVLSSDFGGSTEFAFYNGDQKLDTIPLKESGAVFIRSECDNGVTVKWDSDNWAPAVYNLKKANTSCTLYFGSSEDRACLMHPDGAACKYYKAGETAEILYDDTKDKNLRYVGNDPKNYVFFNCEEGKAESKETCETWRIIGIMNNIEAEDGSMGSHLKIIRDKFDKNYSWDSSEQGINWGDGVNEWSTSAIEKVLNDEYLYRRAGSNLCYKGYRYDTETCPDWSNVGIRESSRNMIASIKWNTGTMPVIYRENTDLITAKYMYEAERSNHNGKDACLATGGGNECNDEVDRTTTWIGKVGLMYSSDYGYAVGGEVREACLGKTMHYYNYSCMKYDWLYDASNYQWTITPVPVSSYAIYVFRVDLSGIVNYTEVCDTYAVRPTLYLKSDVKIVQNDGKDYGGVDNPFVLEM